MNKLTLLKEHQEIIKFLLAEGVDFLVVGGYAVIFHGYPRNTGDIDLLLRPTNETKEKLISALAKAGFETDGLEHLRGLDFTERLVFVFGTEPDRIDFLTKIDRVDFDEAFQKKVMVEISGLQLPVLSLSDLILSKMATGRDKDKADIEVLQEITAHRRKLH